MHGCAPRCFPSTRMISAVFRRGVVLAIVAEELKQVLDQRGGQWSKGRYVGSLVAAIGGIFERHMITFLHRPSRRARRRLFRHPMAYPPLESIRVSQRQRTPGCCAKPGA